MRELKFRAWCDVCQSFQPIMGIIHQDDNGIAIYCPMHEGGAIACKVMQYTGLRDKNGVEIFESDIIEEGQGNGAVEWLERRAAFGYLTDTATIQLYGFCGEVIGNIYENPELLK